MTESDRMLAYRVKAEEVVERVTRQWSNETDAPDAKALTDAVYYALVEEANLELRQILAQMGGQLELASARVDRGQPAFTKEKIGTLSDAVERASDIMEVFMDRASAAKLVIRLDCEDFDLADAMAGYLTAHGLDNKVHAALSRPAPVHADHTKLLDALGHLVTRFYFAARPHEDVLVSINTREGMVEGFIGLSPSHLRPEQLMEEMHIPLNVEDVGIEVAYIRAVLERHDGTLFVATAGDASAGFGFTLPLGGR